MADHHHQPPAPADEVDEATEQTPLLSEPIITPGASRRNATTTTRTGRRHSIASSLASATAALPQATKSGTVVDIICFIVLITSAAGGGFQDLPMTRVFESILCSRYYEKEQGLLGPLDGGGGGGGGPISEDLCKVDAIQSKLAYLLAVRVSMDAAITVVAAIPWGIAADRIGRKPVLALSIASFALNLAWIMIVGWFRDALPVQLIWLASLAFIFGGGNAASNAALGSLVADIVPESERSVSFMRIHASSMVGNLISPALASAMMSATGPWPVMMVSVAGTLAGAGMVLFVPETLHHHHHHHHPSVVAAASLQSHREDASAAAGVNTTTTTPSKTRTGIITQAVAELKDSASILGHRSVVLILAIMFLMMPIVLSTFQFLGQFTSKRYHVPLSQTGYIQTAFGLAHIVVILAVIPYLSKLVLQPWAPRPLRVRSEQRRDLVFARWSFVAFGLGTFVLGASPALPGFVVGLVVMSFGSGAGSFLKSTATLWVDPEHRSRLFTVFGLADIASAMWAGPFLASLFTLGMRLGGDIGIGLPYFGVSVVCVVILVLAMFVQVPPATKKTAMTPGSEDVESSCEDSSDSDQGYGSS
ncbi:major facilitator superfamily domain-containing protein [Xylariomycetidae sp. FL2044]|nr:major facilitator superfamily domain-containing protein [Xylariomycetidae sp. FL2044]